MSHSFRDGEIKGVVVRKLTKAEDSRGWLVEIFRNDELESEFHPTMAYVSSTNPGITRGPHEHREQADLFGFIGPSNFRMRMWDNREDSETFRCVMTVVVGQENPASVFVPAGVVHAYQNIGNAEGIVINCPNKLYRGVGRKAEVDEIRHEHDRDTIFRM